MIDRIILDLRYLAHINAHVIFRSIVGIFMIFSVLLLFGIFGSCVYVFYEIITIVDKNIESETTKKILHYLFFVVSALGVIPLAASKWAKVAYKGTHEILKMMREKLVTNWIPKHVETNIFKEILVRNTENIGRFVKECLRTFPRLIGLVLLIAITCLAAPERAKSLVINFVDTSTKTVSEVFHSQSDTFNIMQVGTWPKGSGEDVKVLFMIFFDNANFRTKAGLTINESNKQILKKLLAAVEQCSKKNPRVNLVVSGFSSVVPFLEGGAAPKKISPHSDRLNLESANLRAKAVVEFLVSHASRTENQSKTNDEDLSCEQKCGEKEGLIFDLQYVKWKSFQQMLESRHLDDGIKSNPIIPYEFFNRVVQIEMRNFCWKDESDMLKLYVQ